MTVKVLHPYSGRLTSGVIIQPGDYADTAIDPGVVSVMVAKGFAHHTDAPARVESVPVIIETPQADNAAALDDPVEADTEEALDYATISVSELADLVTARGLVVTPTGSRGPVKADYLRALGQG